VHVRTLALVPAFNEAMRIGTVIENRNFLGGPTLVIDDGSTDDTARVAREAGATVVSNRRNLGLGRTIRRGYEEALKTDAEVIVQLDADGQYDPAEIPKLLAPIESGEADMVLGSRLENLQYKMPITKKLGNKAFSWVLRKLTGQDVKDGQTGFRAIRREVLEKCLPINEFSYTQEMIIRAAKEGFVIKSVPIHFHKRYDGQSRLFRNPFHFARQGWWIIIRTWRDYHPFKFFVWPGTLFLLASLAAGAIVASHVYYTGGIAGRIGTLVGAGVLFLFGIQLVFMGLLADMIRTHTKY
jgi:glycosyltransferase involved in cell wall biosynthesis